MVEKFGATMNVYMDGAGWRKSGVEVSGGKSGRGIGKRRGCLEVSLVLFSHAVREGFRW